MASGRNESIRRVADQAATSHLEIEFPYFMVKRAPVTGRESVMDYVARFDATACEKHIDFVLTVKIMVTTLCPCSKAIAAHGAHNQRGEVTVQLRSNKAVWIEDVIARRGPQSLTATKGNVTVELRG